MRHQSIVEFSSIEAESFKALKLEPAPTMNSGEFEVHLFPKPAAVRPGEVANRDFLNHFPHNSAVTEYLEHHVAWGEDLVLALRPGEIIPSGRLRDHGDWHWAGMELSHGEGHRDLGAGIGPGDIIIRCTH